MKYGNCLIGLLIILLTIKKRGKIICQKSKYDFVPHLLFRTNDGEIHHYKLIRDILPWPFCYFLFEGHFVKQK